MKKILAVAFLSILIGCNKEIQEKPQEVKMGEKMIGSFTKSEREDFFKTYENLRAQKPNSLSTLINYNCNSEQGCIELCSIIAQTINQMGEDKFITLVKDLSAEDKSKLNGMIILGLREGYRLDEKLANSTAEIEFPKLTPYLKQ
jgi:hypothetical protein